MLRKQLVKNKNQNIILYDNSFKSSEQLPRNFIISFKEVGTEKFPQVRVVVNHDLQAGDIIDDNAYENDGYRYHDIFHYTFATLLGWSPCARAMMKRKRKSNSVVDKVEDGARAAITEEAISLMIFNEAKRKNFFKGAKASVNKHTLRTIKSMTSAFEVRDKTVEEWEQAILKAYEVFRLLVGNKGGLVSFDMLERTVEYQPLHQVRFA